MKFDDNAFLIKRLQNGDEKAYIYLVDLYNRRLFGYALSLSNDHALAEDILQNVFLKTWEQKRRPYQHRNIRIPKCFQENS